MIEDSNFTPLKNSLDHPKQNKKVLLLILIFIVICASIFGLKLNDIPILIDLISK